MHEHNFTSCDGMHPHSFSMFMTPFTTSLAQKNATFFTPTGRFFIVMHKRQNAACSLEVFAHRLVTRIDFWRASPEHGDSMKTQTGTCSSCWQSLYQSPCEDWPAFRGPNHQGQAGAGGIPPSAGGRKNMAWKVKLPALARRAPSFRANAYSSPASRARKAPIVRHLICVERK